MYPFALKPGDVRGRLRVVSLDPVRQKGRCVWNCLCDPELGGCGRMTRAVTGALNSGNTRSCGCLNAEVARERGRRRPNWTKRGDEP